MSQNNELSPSKVVHNLKDAFGLKASKRRIAVMFIDLANSTEAKIKTPEANWLITLGHFYDIVCKNVLENNGNITKFLGDGVMVTFSEDDTAKAINAAIQIQEEMLEDFLDKIASFSCTIGIAVGEAVQFQINNSTDYVGRTIDLAARLCSAASPKAIIIDNATLETVNVAKIVAPRRKFDRKHPISTKYSVKLKGITSPIDCFEIFWWDELFNLKHINDKGE